ncbi:MAG TPA: hypothetical protein VKV19_01195 [Ktedonobacteraceae bacterium]|nr:hypothetical protein [Ktedonobacteraceae bacterium]
MSLSTNLTGGANGACEEQSSYALVFERARLVAPAVFIAFFLSLVHRH